MKIRILSLVVVLSLLITCFSFSIEAEEKVLTKSEALLHLEKLGVIEGFGSLTDESIVTRGEFSAMVIRLLNLKDVISEPEDYSYYDVESDYAYANEVYYLTKMGLLGGSGNGYFMPNAPIETNHAVKVLVTALGYNYEAEAFGGYPTGYQQSAQKLNLLRGVDIRGDGLTFKGVTRLLYNALFVDIMKISGISGTDNIYSSEKGKNILTEYFKLNYKKGILDGIYGLSIGVTSNLEMYDIAIDGMVFKANEDYTSYFGYNVSVLYSIEEETYGDIVSLTENSDKNNVEIIDFSDITGGSLNSFTYEDENGKQETQKLDLETGIVYNRTLKFDFDFSIIDNTKRGAVYLVDNTGDKECDVVIISDYKTYIVSNITDEKITDRLNNPSIDISDQQRKIFVKDENNKIVNLNAVTRNSVLLVIETPEFIEITVSNKKLSGKITEYSQDEFAVDGISYEISPVLNNKTPAFNQTYTLYLDAGGKIVLLETVVSDGYEFAYITKLKSPLREVDYGWLKFFTLDGAFIEFEIKDKLMVNGKGYKPSEFSQMAVQFEINGDFIPQLVKLKFNEEGKLIEIKTAKTILSSTEDDFVMGVGEIKDGTELTYDVTNPNFGGKIFVEKTTRLFLVPPYASLFTASDEDYKVVTTSDLIDNNKYKVSGYYNSKENFFADTAVLYSLTENFTALNNSTIGAVYVRTFTGIDSEGFPAVKYEFMTENGLESFIKACPDSEVENLKKGDAVRIVASDGELVKAEMIYKYQDDDLVSDGTSKTYNTSIRFVKGRPTYVNDMYIRLSYDGMVYDDSNILNMEGFVLKGTILYIKVENTNGNIKVDKGTADDIDKESELLIQQYNGQVKMVVIYK